VLYYVPLAWTGLTWSKRLLSSFAHVFISCRVKSKLRSGEMAVTGDQWPIFLFHGYTYDPDDPWNGLFRSTILVSVRPSSLTLIYFDVNCILRHISTYSRLPALSKRSPRPHDQVTHAFMG
jgi:hypothetical protein